MSDTLLFIFAAACIAAIVIGKGLFDRRKRLEAEAIRAAYATETANAARAEELVRECVMDLKRQRAGAHGPWLAALIDGPMFIQYDEQGRVLVKTVTKPVTPGIALTAVHMTIAELSGSRFNLETLYRAAGELAKMGEGA